MFLERLQCEEHIRDSESGTLALTVAGEKRRWQGWLLILRVSGTKGIVGGTRDSADEVALTQGREVRPSWASC